MADRPDARDPALRPRPHRPAPDRAAGELSGLDPAAPRPQAHDPAPAAPRVAAPHADAASPAPRPGAPRGPEPVPGAAGRLRAALGRAFRALRHRDFRLFFAGQGISLVGTWMQQVAMSWLVYRLTGSAFVLGALGFVSQLPTFLLAPVAGALADRWNRHRIVVATQSLSLAQAALLAALVLSGRIEVWHLLALGAAAGVINGFDVPARQSLFVELVRGPEELANAIDRKSVV